MLHLFRRQMTQERINQISVAVEKCTGEDAQAQALALIEPLMKAQARQALVAQALITLVHDRRFTREEGLEVLRAVFAAHRADAMLLAGVAEAYESTHDVRYLNAAPPDDALPEAVANQVLSLLADQHDGKLERVLQSGLATTARLLGRSWDAVAEGAYRRLIELRGGDSTAYYNLGLFLKTRGRFAEGTEANRQAAQRGAAEDNSVQWNLGICATGASEAQTALEIWKAMGNKIELGRFSLPDGRYPEVKVRLAERPLAERDVAEMPDDPGQEETIWVERLSPCHGIVRSVLYCELGVDYGDVVLFDGAPITHHTYGDTSVPVFPHLATLLRRGYQRYEFAGTQQAEGLLRQLSAEMPDDAVVYVHTEQMAHLCKRCWEDASLDHASHTTADHRVVMGKICVPPMMTPGEVLNAVDAAVQVHPGVRVFAPSLCDAAAQRTRAEIERRRFDMLQQALPSGE